MVVVQQSSHYEGYTVKTYDIKISFHFIPLTKEPNGNFLNTTLNR